MEHISDDFLVASIIKKYNDSGEYIWFNKLEDLLKNRMARGTVSKNIDKLFDFCLISGEWKKNEEGSWVRVFKVAGEAEKLIDKIIGERAVKDECFRDISSRLEAKISARR